MIDRELRILFGKEWRQLVASRSAIATGAIVPVMLLAVLPTVMGLVARAPSDHHHDPMPEGMQFGLFGELEGGLGHFPGAVLPMFVAVVGMVLPTMMATHLLITERERRTLELLVALPVRIEQVMLAKLLATLAAASAMSVPLLLADMIVLPWIGAASLDQIVVLPVLLVAALAFSTSAALLMSLLAKDFRAANNLGGALLAPTIIGTMMLGMVLPGGVVRPLAIALVYAFLAAVVARHALKTVTFERLLT